MNNKQNTHGDNNKVEIFDTTLRDWDQAVGVGFNPKEKIVIAHALRELWVDAIEIGFAASRAENWMEQIVDEIGRDKDSPTIVSLSRADIKDIDDSAEVLKNAIHGRIHTFIATSDDHIRTKFMKSWRCKTLKQTKEKVLEKIEETVSHAVKTGKEVEWSAEVATCSNREYLLKACKIAIIAWASIINIPDTLGTANPWEVEELFKFLIDWTSDLKKEYNFKFSTHNHNDRWLATANNLSAIKWWARQVECTLLGIWERAWNSKLHEIVWSIKDFKIESGSNLYTNIRYKVLWKASYLVARILGTDIIPNEPFIWKLVSAHWSWVHVSWANKGKANWMGDIYKKVDSKNYGVPKVTETFNARSGWAQIVKMLKYYKIILDPQKDKCFIDKIAKRACEIAEEARWIYKENILAIYLEFIWKFKIISITTPTPNEVYITLKINWKIVKIKWKWTDENGHIDGTINWINKFFWKEIVNINHIKIKEREDVIKIAKDLWYDHRKYKITNGHDESWKQTWIIDIELVIWRKKINIKSAGHNVIIETIKAIIYGSVSEMVKKV